MNIPKLLLDYRTQSKLSQEEMAKVFGISQQVYSKIESGKNKKYNSEFIIQVQALVNGNKTLQQIGVENNKAILKSNNKIPDNNKGENLLSNPHINMGGNTLNNINKSIQKNKSIETLDIDIKSSLTLLSPTRIKLLTDDHQIDKDTFQRLFPTISHANGWMPVLSNISQLVELGNSAIDKGDKRPTWPMEADEIVRNPFVIADYATTAPPYDNMAPIIRAGEHIYITYVDKAKYKPGKMYFVVFSDKEAMIYYISQGHDKGEVRLHSHVPGFERDYPLKDIEMIFAISPRF